MKIIKGDLIKLALEGNFDVIIHGCNCFHTMGAGIARQIRLKWPGVFEADLQTKKGPEKLGTYSKHMVSLPSGTSMVVVNAYTQGRFFGADILVDYAAVETVLPPSKKISERCELVIQKSARGWPVEIGESFRKLSTAI